MRCSMQCDVRCDASVERLAMRCLGDAEHLRIGCSCLLGLWSGPASAGQGSRLAAGPRARAHAQAMVIRAVSVSPGSRSRRPARRAEASSCASALGWAVWGSTQTAFHGVYTTTVFESAPKWMPTETSEPLRTAGDRTPT